VTGVITNFLDPHTKKREEKRKYKKIKKQLYLRIKKYEGGYIESPMPFSIFVIINLQIYVYLFSFNDGGAHFFQKMKLFFFQKKLENNEFKKN